MIQDRVREDQGPAQDKLRLFNKTYDAIPRDLSKNLPIDESMMINNGQNDSLFNIQDFEYQAGKTDNISKRTNDIMFTTQQSNLTK